MKTCTVCGEEKPLTEFSPTHTTIKGKRYDYHRADCKPCHNESVKAQNRRKARATA